MRLKCHTVLLTKQGNHRLNVAALLPRHVGQVVEYGVLVGAHARLAARLSLTRVPPEVAEHRRARLEEEARDKGQPVSQEQWEVAEWTIGSTNVATRRLSVWEALRLLRVRGQIERLSKRWKQEGQSDAWRSKKPWRIWCELQGKLAAMVLHHRVLLLGGWHDPCRGLVKAARVGRQHAGRLLAALRGEGSLATALRATVYAMQTGCRLARNRNRPCMAQILLEELDWPGFDP